MKIPTERPLQVLAIETSCDETAIAILECMGDEQRSTFTVLGNALLSQIELHKPYGGVFPTLAKREHAKNLVPILESALRKAKLLREGAPEISKETHTAISEALSREPGLAEAFLEFISTCESPSIDAIAVTAGPGLEPALWVGVNFAKALALIWRKPLVAVNHMEGHIFAALAEKNGEKFSISNLQFPILALLISGGHTELVVMKKWLEYERIGQTRDDAVGEAFDKVARMLSLPYPGGPEISRIAEIARKEGGNNSYTLPRPMLRENNCDFSFAGLKTAVLYLLKGIPSADENEKKYIAHEFENAVADVLWHKTSRALAETDARTLVIGGGVSANNHIRRVFMEKIHNEYPDVTLSIPTATLSTDNAIMIALAGYHRVLRNEYVQPFDKLRASGNLSLA